MEVSNVMKAQTVYGQFDPQAGLALSDTDPCRELGDVCAGEHGTAESELLESILDRANLNAAWRRVRSNGGASGIDGMSIEDFLPFARANWSRIETQLREGTYRPAAVRRVWIP